MKIIGELGDIPEELLEYLHTLITPPKGETIVALDLDQVEWSEYGDEQVHGLIYCGNPSPYLDEIWRVLKPGAHVVGFPSEQEPTNHTAACGLEDTGFEIRDQICWVRDAGDLQYVPKASSSERNAGMPDRNIHPTVKPIGIFEALLADVPLDATVVDPFVGSGTTGIACLRTGHNAILMDREKEYLEIADRRIRHWDRAEAGWIGADIESEVEPDDSAPKEQMTLDDLFDME
jgi:DNA modification methylase